MSIMRMGKSLRVIMSVTATILVSSGSASADIVIDEFSSVDSPNPWPATMTTIGNNLITEINLANVLGGVRQTTVFGSSFDSAGDIITANIDSGQLFYNSTAGANGALGLFYTGFPGGLQQDFTNETGINIDFADYGINARSSGGGSLANVTVDIFNGSSNASRTMSLSSFGAQDLFFDFSLFVGIGSVDLSDINRISVSIDPLGSGQNFTLNSIHTVTIPAPGMLAMLGVAGLVTRGRRRRI